MKNPAYHCNGKKRGSYQFHHLRSYNIMDNDLHHVKFKVLWGMLEHPSWTSTLGMVFEIGILLSVGGAFVHNKVCGPGTDYGSLWSLS